MRFLVGGVLPMSIAFCSPSIFRKSHESALLDLWRFQSYGDEMGWQYFTSPQLAIQGLILEKNVSMVITGTDTVANLNLTM